MSVHSIRPTVTALTECPSGHIDSVTAINPVISGGEVVEAFWPSAHDFCMECDEPVRVTSVEVER